MKMLHKYHGLFHGAPQAPGSPVYELFRDGTTVSAGNNWQDISTASLQNLFLSSTYFDLAGLAVEDETLFLDAATVQSVGSNIITNGAAGDNFTVWDIMTSVPVDFTELDITWIYRGLGFPGTVLNFEHVLYQRRERYSLIQDTGAYIPQLIESEQSGSLEATASDRIYSYRLVLIEALSAGGGPPPTGPTAIFVSPARHLVQAEAKAEAEYQYLMRLKRSYDLQNEPDVDKS